MFIQLLLVLEMKLVTYKADLHFGPDCKCAQILRLLLGKKRVRIRIAEIRHIVRPNIFFGVL